MLDLHPVGFAVLAVVRNLVVAALLFVLHREKVVVGREVRRPAAPGADKTADAAEVDIIHYAVEGGAGQHP